MLPFVFGKLATGKNFIDREKERQKLKQNLNGQISTMLISPRRWGKSSLVQAVADEMKRESKEIRFCFIDLFNVRSEEEFYELYAGEVLKTTSSKWQDWAENGKTFIKNIIPQFSFGMDPQNEFHVSFDLRQIKKSANEILQMPEIISEKKKIKIIVCIDEFQNISFFEEPLVFQKKLRSVWQHHQHSTYCLYGSKRHMLIHMFESRSMPFYKFGDLMFLDKIEEKYWVRYITTQFRKSGKNIDKGLAKSIARLMEYHPYYVQYFSNLIWQKTDNVCTEKIFYEALDGLLLQSSILFIREIDNLSNTQVNFLKALSEGVQKFSSRKTLVNYNLGSQGNIKNIKTALENKEIIDLLGKRIEFLDPVFKLWFLREYMKRP